MNNDYLFPLCIQLPFAVSDVRDDYFLSILDQLLARGFYGVEVNILDFSPESAEALKTVLDERNLKLTMVASGAWAKANGYSLSHVDEKKRAETIQAFQGVMDYADRFGAGIICGFIKGGPGGDKREKANAMLASLRALAATGKLTGVELYLEATHHDEALLINTLAEGASLAGLIDAPLRILPDTYHMNIEEADIFAALTRHRSCYSNLHISDNNRYFPGKGSIDFVSIFRFLKGMGYEGTVTIEGRCHKTLSSDIDDCCAYLEQVSRQASEEVDFIHQDLK